MNMHTCPHCGKEGISAIRKLYLGPAFPTRCQNCKDKIGVPYWSLLTLAPMLLGFSFLPIFVEGSFLAISVTLATLTTGVLWFCLVPLKKK